MEVTGKPQNSFMIKLASRIRCELNDLKRTPESAATDLGFSVEHVYRILKGLASREQYYDFIGQMGKVYPIDSWNLSLLEKDTTRGIKFSSHKESEKSKRIYKRLDKLGNTTDYYQYRDTAMSCLALFKPEWIEVLKNVDDSTANNPKVVMNKGHFLHQVTLFIGPVNFYYEDSEGQTHCVEMSTGDSNYISPFVKHSFTSRSKDEFTCIIAVTFGGDVSRCQRELYALGENKIQSFLLEQTPQYSLLKQHLKNCLFSEEMFRELIKNNNGGVDILERFINNDQLLLEELECLSINLGVGVDKLIIEPNNTVCVIKKFEKKEGMSFPSSKDHLYTLHPLANQKKTDIVRSAMLKVETKVHNMKCAFERSMHTYLINCSNTPVVLKWEYESKYYTKTLNIFDSVYLEPFVRFCFATTNDKGSNIFIVGVKSSVNLDAQKELSSFVDATRTIKEEEEWYEKK